VAAGAGLLQEDTVTLENKMREAEVETEILKRRMSQSNTAPEVAQAVQEQLLRLQEAQRQLGERLVQAQAATRQDQPVRQGQTVPPSVDEYRIKPGDVLTVFVFNHAELNREKVRVQPDGRASTPLVQSVPASGLTPAELKVEIEKRLKEVIDRPNVTVMFESN
jgi:protein involved in polysaccharide export with SLBB domain